MGLQLEHVFARVAVRAGKEQRQAVVYGLALGIAQRQIGGFAGFERAPAQALHQRCQPFAGNPHNAHGSATGGCGNGGNGISVAGQHGRTLWDKNAGRWRG
ncbi:hypothetical protein D3C78_1635050 [compost metagenome]